MGVRCALIPKISPVLDPPLVPFPCTIVSSQLLAVLSREAKSSSDHSTALYIDNPSHNPPRHFMLHSPATDAVVTTNKRVSRHSRQHISLTDLWESPKLTAFRATSSARAAICRSAVSLNLCWKTLRNSILRWAEFFFRAPPPLERNSVLGPLC